LLFNVVAIAEKFVFLQKSSRRFAVLFSGYVDPKMGLVHFKAASKTYR